MKSRSVQFLACKITKNLVNHLVAGYF